MADLEGVRKEWSPEAVVQRIAQVAEAVSWQAGIGGMEFAGQLVSVFAKHPEMIAPFLEGGSGFLLENEIGAELGCLTFYNQAGEITTPETLARARTARRMLLKAGATPPATPPHQPKEGG